MVHTNPNTAGRFFHYYNMHLNQRMDMSRRRNPSFDERFGTFAHRKFFAERGLDFSRINDARVREIAQERGWQGFIRNPDFYDPSLVLEFYAAMMPPVFEEFSTVIVRNRTIRMSNEDICNYFNAPRYPELDRTFGIPPIPGIGQDESHSPIIASSLRTNGNRRWEARRAEIKKRELEPALGFWLLFVKSSLTPSAHVTTINPYVARIMYCIQHNMPLDIGHIIRLHMIDAAAETCTGVLPFPCLITQFCRDAGIQTGHTIQAFPPYKLSAYQLHVASVNRSAREAAHSSERMNIAEEVDEEEADDEDYNPEQEEGFQHTNVFGQVNQRLDNLTREMREGFARMERGFRYLGVPDEEEEQQQRQRRRQPGEGSSRRRNRG